MIVKIFNGEYLKRLDNILQWQERDVFKQESVSQHSYKVSVFCRILLSEVFGREIREDVVRFQLDCVTYAMFHDWDESLIRRDLSHDMKYNNFNGMDIRKVVDELSSHLATVEFTEFSSPDTVTPASEMLLSNLMSVDENVKVFVKFCDWLALRFYIERELSLGNQAFEETLKYCKIAMKDSAKKVQEMLRKEFSGIFTNYPVLSTLI